MEFEFSIKLHTIKSGWSSVDIEGSSYTYNSPPPPPPPKKNTPKSKKKPTTKNNGFLSLKIDFVLANSADPDEMLHYAAFSSGPSLLRYPFRGSQSKKGLMHLQAAKAWLNYA